MKEIKWEGVHFKKQKNFLKCIVCTMYIVNRLEIAVNSPVEIVE